jgi:hypothetical protein
MSVPELNTAIYSTLAGTVTAAGSAVFLDQAPDAQALPYVVFDYTADLTENITPSDMNNTLVFIRAYATTKAQAGTIDQQIKTLLHLQELSVSGYANFWTARESAFSFTETDPAGRKTCMAGAEYRIRLTKE